ncbi:Protein Njmu-R1, partial [Stegodyphus mimosarum]
MSAIVDKTDSRSECYSESTSSSNSRYALYLFSNNKHASTSDIISKEQDHVNNSKPDCDEPSVCLSLLEGNLDAEQETVVRCYLLKTLSGREDLSFENEGKYAVLQFSDDSDQSFGCYYHRLSKNAPAADENTSDIITSPKVYTFFICLIGPANGAMESFCPELGIFCQGLLHSLDPEGSKDQAHVQFRLKSWYFYCIEYVGRCIQRFKEDISLVLHCSLWGNVEIVSEDENIKWDLERFVETASLMPRIPDKAKEESSSLQSVLTVKISDVKIETSKPIAPSFYCSRWYDKLKNCHESDHIGMHNILEGFRLKAIQDLNTLKRLLQKAETDHYSLYRAYQFLKASGYDDVLLHHVKREVTVTGEEEVLEIIACLQDFIKNKKSGPN